MLNSGHAIRKALIIQVLAASILMGGPQGHRKESAEAEKKIESAEGHLAKLNYEKALASYNEALVLYRDLGDKSGGSSTPGESRTLGESKTLNDIGSVYYDLADRQKAMQYFTQARQIVPADEPSLQADILGNLGVVYNDLGDSQKALDFDRQALAIHDALGDLAGQGNTLNNIGAVYADLGDTLTALTYFSQALPLRRAAADRSGEALTLDNMSAVLEKTSPESAIFLAKQAVNVLQTIRQDNKLLLKHSARKRFKKSVEGYYRSLAGLLVARGRFGEAEQVLNLLKGKEASDFVRDAASDSLAPADLTDFEMKAKADYDSNVDSIIAFGNLKAPLAAKARLTPLSADEKRQLADLNQHIESANAVLSSYLGQLETRFPAGSGQAKTVANVKDAQALQETLQKLGPDVVVIYTFVLPDRYTAILITGQAQQAFTSLIPEEKLNQLIAAFRTRLEDPRSNPLPEAQQLYSIVFPEKLRERLDSQHVKTIIWSIDGPLRYVPIAALHDGRQYLVSAFRNSLITNGSLSRLDAQPPAAAKGLGFGVSKGAPGFSALPGVPVELNRIFASQSAPLAGRILEDDSFTEAAFRNAMDVPDADKSVVHIATHFDSKPGSSADSRLLLGGGDVMTLQQISAIGNLFSGVDLLTLSACSTGFTGSGADGREVDSLGTIAQRLGAHAVIASLWSVSDEATSRLMETMYGVRKSHPELGKSEALRQAQQQMVDSTLKPASAEVAARSLEASIAAKPVPAGTNWTHPFYWAPFILMGNWQ